MVQWIATHGKAADRLVAHAAHGVHLALSLVEEGVEDRAVLVRNQMGIDAGGVNAGESLTTLGGHGEGACLADGILHAVADGEPLARIVRVAEVEVEGGFITRFLVVDQAGTVAVAVLGEKILELLTL